MSDLGTHEVTNQVPPRPDGDLLDTDPALTEALDREGGDRAALDNLLTTFGVQSQSMDPAQARALAERFIVGWGGYPLVGTPQQVAEEIGRLADIGVDILLLSWLDYVPELDYFGERVLPRLRDLGLRA